MTSTISSAKVAKIETNIQQMPTEARRKWVTLHVILKCFNTLINSQTRSKLSNNGTQAARDTIHHFVWNQIYNNKNPYRIKDKVRP